MTEPLESSLDKLMHELGEKIVKGIYISVATDNDYDTAPLEKWLKHQIHQIIDRKVAEARIDEHDAVIEASCELSDSAFHAWSDKRLAQLSKGDNK